MGVGTDCAPLTIHMRFLREVGPNCVCGNVLLALISVRPHLPIGPQANCKLPVATVD
jgi:hypothetical protein